MLTFFDLQQKLKEEREAKRASLDSRHQYLFSAIAAKLGTDEQAVEELVLDGVQVSQFRSSVIQSVQLLLTTLQLDAIETFFSATGPKSLIFYYEETAGKDGEIACW